MNGIKLFVCCHKCSGIPQNPLLVPLQVGASLAEARFPGYLHDNTGENISEKNRSYCELTAQYWAWKNIEADYYGFFHYRRYLYPDTCAKRPYCIAQEPTQMLLDKLGYTGFEDLIKAYDLIAPMAEDMHLPVREHYADAPFHHRRDLTLVEQIVRELYPEITDAMERYLSGTMCYFGNIYIMKQRLFHDYCAWLFPVLEAFDRRADTSGYSPQEQRVDGYLAERLFGIFYFKRKCEGIKVLELPRVDFIPSAGTRYRRKLVNALLPPGSKRRAAGKRWANHG